MKPLPWRILAVVDAGVDSAGPATVTREGLDSWFASLDTGADVPAAAGGKRRVALAGAASFAPAAVRAALGAGAAPAAVDAALHDPAFQRIESAYRGLRLLLEHAGDAVQVEAVSVRRAALADRLREAVVEPALRSEFPPSLILADYEFSHQGPEVALLGRLADAAETLQSPLVAAASARFFDLRYLVQAASLPDLAARLVDQAHAAWLQFQATDAARWVALCVNRYLQRAPWTEGQGGHEEQVSESNPDSYLWGRGQWLLGAAMARSARQHGHPLAIAGSQGGGFAGMPTRPWKVAANESVALAAEAPLSEQQALELYRAAFSPVIAPLRSDSVMIPMAMTVFRLRPGKPTVEGTLGYQLMASRLAQRCGQLLEALPADATQAAEHLRSGMLEHLGPLAGEKPEQAVRVELREEKAEGKGLTVAALEVRPAATLEGKPLEFAFRLPLVAA